jgi:hypothetical protein
MEYKLNMKKLALTLLVLLLIPSVLGAKGVGIAWTQESAIFMEGEKPCLTYGVYNPFDEDVEITLNAEGFEDLNPTSETKFVEAGTINANAEEINLCFKIPQTYSDCVEKVIDGKIIAREAPKSIQGVTGSATVAIASVPLDIKITCNPSAINPMLIVLLFAALIIGAAFYFRKK